MKARRYGRLTAKMAAGYLAPVYFPAAVCACAAAAFFIAFLPGGADAAPDASKFSGRAGRAAVEKAFTEFFATELPGSSATGAAAVFVSAGEFTFSACYGTASRGGADCDPALTAFQVGSVTKLFTCVAALSLMSSGRLEPAARASAYLPRHSDALGGTRISDLMTHSAPWRNERPVPVIVAARGYDRESFVARHLAAAVPARSGAIRYSNLGMELLGLIVGGAGGRGYERYVQEVVFDGLGMRSSGIGAPRGRARAAAGYSNGHEVPGGTRHSMPAASAVYTTAADMAVFIEALASGEVSLAGVIDSTREAMLKSVAVKAGPHDAIAGFDRFPPFGGMTCGFRYSEVAGETVLWQTGTVPGFAAGLYYFPSLGKAAFVACNSSGTRLRQKFLKMVLEGMKR